MGDVIDFLPLEIRNELGTLQRMRNDMVERRLVVLDDGGTDVTLREAANLGAVIDQLQKALAHVAGKRKPDANRT